MAKISNKQKQTSTTRGKKLVEINRDGKSFLTDGDEIVKSSNVTVEDQQAMVVKQGKIKYLSKNANEI